MKKILITFGDEKYKSALNLLRESSYKIGHVDSVKIYNHKRLGSFYDQNKFILDQPRGAGFWLWKSFIILNVMKNSDAGDIIIYSDAGLQVIGDLTLLYECADKNDRLIFKLPPHGVPVHKANQWIKGDCFGMMNCNEQKYWEADMTNGAISVWKNTEENQRYIKEWLRWSKISQIITDSPSAIFQNLYGFKDHRHDQAILSNLRVKYDWELFRDPTQYGEIEEFDNSPYPQLFWHHRNFKHPKT